MGHPRTHPWENGWGRHERGLPQLKGKPVAIYCCKQHRLGAGRDRLSGEWWCTLGAVVAKSPSMVLFWCMAASTSSPTMLLLAILLKSTW